MVDFTVSAALNAIIIASSFVLVAVRQVQNSLHIGLENKKQNLVRFEEEFEAIAQGGEKALKKRYGRFCDEAEIVRNYSLEEKEWSFRISIFFLVIIIFALSIHLGTLLFPFLTAWKLITGMLVLASAGTVVFSIFLIKKLVKGAEEYEAAYIRAEALLRTAKEEVEASA